MTSFFLKIEDDLNHLKMKDDLHSFQKGRRHQLLGNGRQPQILKMEGDLNFFETSRRPTFFSENGR